MSFLLEIGGEKELSIPLLMGIILYAQTSQFTVLFATIIYTISASMLAEYTEKMRLFIDYEVADENKLKNLAYQLLENRLYVESNHEAKFVRGILVSTIIMIVPLMYLVIQSTLFLMTEFNDSNIMLVLLVTTTYSIYSVFNYLVKNIFRDVFEAMIVIFSTLIGGTKEEEIESVNLEK